MENEIIQNNRLTSLADSIVCLIDSAKKTAAVSVSSIMVKTYWAVGKHIVEFEQNGNSKAEYGTQLLTNLAKILTLKLGKGYSRPNLNNMRKFYVMYPNLSDMSDKLTWSHICEKKNSVKHEDIGQMNMYMGYFAKEENEPDDNPPIGIILSHNKDELLVEYSTYGMDSNLFVAKYELYLPNKEELKRLVDGIIKDN